MCLSQHRVTFLSQLEAHLTLRSLLRDVQCHQGMIRKEYAVIGCNLIVSVPDEFALRIGAGGWRVLWLSSLLRVLWWRCWGAWYKGGLVPWTYRNNLPFNLIFPTFSRWTTEDLALIQISISSFLDQLSLVIQNIQSLGIPPFRGWGRWLKPVFVSLTRQDIGDSNLRAITTLLFECKFLPLLAFGISWFTCFVSLLREEWDASVFHSRK